MKTYRGQTHKFAPSKFQAAVIDEVLDGRGNIVVSAVAGSGKTSTLTMLAKYVDKGLFCAFNRHIAKELGEALRGTGIEVRTLHSVGMGAVKYHINRRQKVDAKKYGEEFSRRLGIDRSNGWGKRLSDEKREMAFEVRRAASNVWDKLRVNLRPLDESHVKEVIDIYNVDIAPHGAPFAMLMNTLRGIDEWGIAKAGDGVIDFSDMIWLPNVVPGCRPYQHRWVMVDECQDLSAAQLGVALAATRRGGRMLFVGDRAQAIYGFAGADSHSVDRIIERTGAKELPLSVCYRCPRTHIVAAQTLCPQIEPCEWAEEGEVAIVQRESLADKAKDGDIIVCRTTAPLIKPCFELIAAGIAAKIRGRDIGASLVAVVEACEQHNPFRWSRFAEHVDRWAHDEREKMLKRNGDDDEDPRLGLIDDKRDAVIQIFERREPTDSTSLKSFILDLFSDERAPVWLSTVHRAKGLEADRVFILRPDLMPLPFVSRPEEYTQELNIKYVALTRAKKALYPVECAESGSAAADIVRSAGLDPTECRD